MRQSFSQDQVTWTIAGGVASDAMTGWSNWIPDQNLQNVMYEVIILWTVIQITIKIYNFAKGNSNDED